jgi:IS30 family transposase
LKKAGLTQCAIADQIGVNKSTISREFKRNTGLRGYRPKQAHRLACARQSQIQRNRISHATWTEIEEMTCIPGRKSRSKPIKYDKRRNRIEIMFGRLKNWRRVATRYDRCPKVFLSAVALAATVMFWL